MRLEDTHYAEGERYRFTHCACAALCSSVGKGPSRHRAPKHFAAAGGGCGGIHVNLVNVAPSPVHTAANLPCILWADNLHIAAHLTEHHLTMKALKLRLETWMRKKDTSEQVLGLSCAVSCKGLHRRDPAIKHCSTVCQSETMSSELTAILRPPSVLKTNWVPDWSLAALHPPVATSCTNMDCHISLTWHMWMQAPTNGLCASSSTSCHWYL